jgi:hypothetical protein
VHEAQVVGCGYEIMAMLQLHNQLVKQPFACRAYLVKFNSHAMAAPVWSVQYPSASFEHELSDVMGSIGIPAKNFTPIYS